MNENGQGNGSGSGTGSGEQMSQLYPVDFTGLGMDNLHLDSELGLNM